MAEPVWISRRLALAIHQRQLAEHGGTPGVRDEGLLESALARPRQAAAYGDPDLAELAGRYAFGICRNHPFLDGNKRTAYVACRTFLLLNGSDLTAPAGERYRVFLALAAGEMGEDEVIGWIRGQIEPLTRA